MKNTMIETIFKIYSQETNTQNNKDIEDAALKIISHARNYGGSTDSMSELLTDFEYEVKKYSFIDGFKAGMMLALETLKTASR